MKGDEYYGKKRTKLEKEIRDVYRGEGREVAV